jgi:hypothetical protein
VRKYEVKALVYEDGDYHTVTRQEAAQRGFFSLYERDDMGLAAIVDDYPTLKDALLAFILRIAGSGEVFSIEVFEEPEQALVT